MKERKIGLMSWSYIWGLNKLATIDLDPVETEDFAESVASIAIKREKNSSFQKFQVRKVPNNAYCF